MIAGFLPCEVVRERIQKKIRIGNKIWQYTNKHNFSKDNRSSLQLELKIQDLMHPRGLLPYLFEPKIDEVHKQSNSATQADKLAVFYLRCGFYQKALEQIKISLQFQPASYDALLNKSACFFAFAQDQVYNLYQKQVLYPTDEDTLQQELELIYGDCLEWDDDLSQFIQEQHRQLYPITSKAPQRITSPYSDDDYLYWQVIKDTSLAISIDARRPEAYVNRALAYEELSLRRGMPNLKLAGLAIRDHTQAISCSAKKNKHAISSPLFYYYRGRAYADYASPGLISRNRHIKWGLIYCRKAMVDLEAAYDGYSKLKCIGNAEKAMSDLRILQTMYERFISGQPIIGTNV
jgi:hypothetical protein